MPNEVRKLWVGITVLGIAVYIGLNPDSILGKFLLVSSFTGGVLLSTITLFALEAGIRFVTLNGAEVLDRIIGVGQLVMAALLIGFVYDACLTDRWDVFFTAGVGAIFYCFFIRNPVFAHFKK